MLPAPLRTALVLSATAVAVAVTAVAPAQAAVAPGNPIGSLDTAVDGHGLRGSAGNLHLTGWTIDGDEPTSSPFVDVYVDGTGAGRYIANVPRPDLAGLAAGQHGFDVFLNVTPGLRTVCVYAIGIGPGGPPDGRNPQLGCKQVLVRPGGEPIGSADAIVPSPDNAGRVLVRGWASDPDAPSAALGVDVYVDLGKPSGYGWTFDEVTSAPRPDVPRVFPSVGPQQGFSVEVPVPAGTHQVCAFAIDRSGTPGNNTLLGCRTVS